MDASQSTSNQKRQHDREPDPLPQRKSQRLRDESNGPLKITDLNNNCLEKIFGHLDLWGLFNVAVANEWLRPTAAVVYRHKFGEKTVNITKRSDPEVMADGIDVGGLKICLQYLRCLGSSIDNLCIQYDGWSNTQRDYIHQYVNEYCYDSSVEIDFSFQYLTWHPIKHFKKPFVNVHNVSFYSGCLCELSSFSQWFPNIRSSSVFADFIGQFSTDVPFHQLEDLFIEIGDGDGLHGFTTSKAARLLQLCPQLRKLTIGARIKLKTLSDIIKHNPNIRKMTVVEKHIVPTIESNIQQLVDEHPSLVEIELAGFRFAVDVVLSMIRQLTSLKLLLFQIANRSEYDRLLSQLDSKWQSEVQERCGNLYITLQR